MSEQNNTSECEEHYFTFGMGHECPYTYKNLAFHYVTIVAPGEDVAREIMYRLFGQRWAFHYDTLDEATDYGKHKLREHIRVEINAAHG